MFARTAPPFAAFRNPPSARPAESTDLAALGRLLIAVHGAHSFDLAASIRRGHMFVLESTGGLDAAAHIAVDPPLGRLRRPRVTLRLLVVDPTLSDHVARVREQLLLRVAFAVAETYAAELEVPASPYVTWRRR